MNKPLFTEEQFEALGEILYKCFDKSEAFNWADFFKDKEVLRQLLVQPDNGIAAVNNGFTGETFIETYDKRVHFLVPLELSDDELNEVIDYAEKGYKYKPGQALDMHAAFKQVFKG